MLGPDGQVERSVRFSSMEVGQRDARTMSPPGNVTSHTAEKLTSLPDGYRVPGAPAGFELVTRSAIPTACCCSTATVCSPRRCSSSRVISTGALFRVAAASQQLADTRTRTYHEASGDVAVWERNGLVYTCVTDVPSDVFSDMIGVLASEGRSTPEAIVDFVLGPFGWG